jgi:16S rRNA (cytidine1402-2'-O)-methyltransferase
MTGTLFLIPTTLASPGSPPESLAAVLPPEVAQTAARLEYFVVENAKSARTFLKACLITQPLQSLHVQELNAHTPPENIAAMLLPLKQGHDLGLLSEAGCPAVADPGAALVGLAHEAGLRVQPLVGPSALLLALMASGLNGQSFAFHGYLPTEPGARQNRLRELELRSKNEHQTQMFIEAPYRNPALFSALLQHLTPSTRLCVATELSLAGETVRTLPVQHWKRLPTPDLRKKPTVFLLLA